MNKLVDFFGCGYVINDTPMKLQYRIRDRKDLSVPARVARGS